ncbi:hypothetical protein HS088_TW07G00118 [Tripterygium wilfordii]|uniref:Uncharacterized protein n=1 Tax=Tripterygium wilfordii TaxID=458696 RepID=A0A7J7DDU0_TRIWF|nr:uncharacterized protein LOC120001432 [Tripterygium wilfordii]KAF5744545.1 hypothetical protein HS088_TW07G00118 [Tripterygium wilfordii]
MASTIANRTVVSNRNLSLSRLSLNLFRSFTTSAPSSGQNPNSNNGLKKPKRKKKKNLFEVAQFLPNWGIGYQMAKTHWTGVSYQITKINLYKDGRHGKAWGIVHKDGLPAADAPKKISGVHKRCWKYITSLTKPTETMPNLTKSTESTEESEIQTA